jgi:hypothetical protein
VSPDAAIARLINLEAKRTDGMHPVSHVIIADGYAYAVPRRRDYRDGKGASRREDGTVSTSTVSHVAAKDLSRWRIGRMSRCLCADCAAAKGVA